MQVEMKSIVEIDVELMAKLFAELDDDSQCKFLVEVARIASTWEGRADTQWYYIGGHLRNCKCSTDEARDMIRQIAYHMEHSNHGIEAVL